MITEHFLRKGLRIDRPGRAFVGLMCASVLFALGSIEAVTATDAPPAYGTFLRLFAADSPWNSRPVSPTLGDFVIPKSDYFPSVAEGPWSSGIFLAKAGDPPTVVHATPGKVGVWDPDAEREHDVTIPRWPADVTPATQLDGHADIVDPIAGVVHSFWQLKQVDGRWIASLYAWTPLNGRGWGDPSHYYQGARATGVPPAGGLIRKHEVDDGDDLYRHALSLSLTYNALSANPIYVFPATSADGDAASANKGRIPEGALLMLPSTFDAHSLATPELRKVAETLKVYGAYVVDRNVGTPYSIYVEIGANFRLHRNGWDNAAAGDLDRIRQALRQVVSTKGWLDGNGRPFTPERNFNLLSMRGPWRVLSGPPLAAGVFDTLAQAVVFDKPAQERIVQVNETGRGLQPVLWALPIEGRSYRLEAVATGGARLRVQLRAKTHAAVLFDSGELAQGESKTFKWPADAAIVVQAISGTAASSSVSGKLIAIDGN